MMPTRRDALLAFPLLGTTTHGTAQPPAAGQSKRIGILGISRRPYYPLVQFPFVATLVKKGWIPGKNLAVEAVYADGDVERLPELADDLVRKGLDIIVTSGLVSTVAAARATRTVPILFRKASTPVEVGLIDSFARPGRNATGIAASGVDVSSKRLQFLREIVPNAKRLSWLVGSRSTFIETVSGGRWDVAAAIEAASRGVGFEIRWHTTTQGKDLDAVLGDAVAWGAQALSVTWWPGDDFPNRLAALALRHRLPSACIEVENVEAGALLSFADARSGESLLDARFIDMVDSILRGAKPGELPVERPNLYELALNLNTARALRLTIPSSILVRADVVIE